MTLSIITLNIMTLSVMAFSIIAFNNNIMTISIMTFSIITFNTTTHSTTTFNILELIMMTLNKLTLFVIIFNIITLTILTTQICSSECCSWAIMLNVIMLSVFMLSVVIPIVVVPKLSNFWWHNKLPWSIWSWLWNSIIVGGLSNKIFLRKAQSIFKSGCRHHFNLFWKRSRLTTDGGVLKRTEKKWNPGNYPFPIRMSRLLVNIFVIFLFNGYYLTENIPLLVVSTDKPGCDNVWQALKAILAFLRPFHPY
jgi:hypothetical protein